MVQLSQPSLVFNSYPNSVGQSPFTINTGVPDALVVLDYYVYAGAGANGRGVVYGAGAIEPYGDYNVGFNNGGASALLLPGSLLVRTDAQGHVRAHFDQASSGVTFVVWLRDVVDDASGGLAPKVSTYVQPTGSPNTGAGVLRVEAGVGDRSVELTHYQYGATLRTRGPDSGGMFEFFLGDQPGHHPDLSVRHNGSNLGAIIEARNKQDSGAIALSFFNPARAELQLRGNDLPDDFSITHPSANGFVSFRVGGAERVRVTKDGIKIGSALLTEAKLLALLALLG